ncbi:MAG: helix-turn-helix domain-containing protein [Chloroflexota bacterium]|nr:helix-turn-helix domain-containing protein [Chloroflexota bacterium]
MSIIYEERPSDAPFVQSVARIQAERDGFSLIPADGHWYLYITTLNGKTTFTVGGPITKALSLPHAAGAESVGIRLRLGTFMPHLPVKLLVDGVITLPDASSQSFWLNSSAWQFPTLDNAETFVGRLVRTGILVCEPVIDAALQGDTSNLSVRSVQRRFLQATGLTPVLIRQIERARHATALLQQGDSISDAVYTAGYFDQAHLTHALKRFMGQTPAQIARPTSPP